MQTYSRIKDVAPVPDHDYIVSFPEEIGEIEEKPAETQSSNWLSNSLVRTSNSYSGGEDFKSLAMT